MAITGIGVAPAHAAIDQWLDNPSQVNESVLAQIMELTGGDEHEVRALLEQLDLLDEDGNLRNDHAIVIDGHEFTLDEAIEFIDDPLTDLDAMASVAGRELPLRDLRTIIEIERELARIEATYFSGATFTPEQTEALEGLLAQISEYGIGFQNPLADRAPAGSIDHEARIAFTQTNGNPADLTIPALTATRELRIPARSYPVSFDFDVYPGNLNARLCTATEWTNCDIRVSVTVDGVEYRPGQRVTIPADVSAARVSTIRLDNRWLPDGITAGQDGFLIRFSNPVNSAFLRPETPVQPASATAQSLTIVAQRTAAAGIGDVPVPVGGNADHVRLTRTRAQMEPQVPLRFGWTYGQYIDSFGSGASRYGAAWGHWYIGLNWGNSLAADLADFYAAHWAGSFDTTTRINLTTADDFPRTGCYHWEPGWQTNTTGNFAGCGGSYIHSGLPTDFFPTLPSGARDVARFGGGVPSLHSTDRAHARTDQLRFRHSIISTSNTLPNLTSFTDAQRFALGDGILVPANRPAPARISVNDGGVVEIQQVPDTPTPVPTVTSVTVAPGTFGVGELIPITVRFSEPVWSDQAQIQVFGGTAASESIQANNHLPLASGVRPRTFSQAHTFGYLVTADNPGSVIVSSVSGAQNVFGTAMATDTNLDAGWTFDSDNGGVRFAAASMAETVLSFSVPPITSASDFLADGIEFALELDNSEDSQTLFANYADGDLTRTPFTAVVHRHEGNPIAVPLEFAMGGPTGPWWAEGVLPGDPAFLGMDGEVYLVELLIDELGAGGPRNAPVVLVGSAMPFEIEGIVPATGATMSIGYRHSNPEAHQLTLSLIDGDSIRLQAQLPADATCSDGVWIANNPSIVGLAEAPEPNTVFTAPTGLRGAASFTFHATNCGLTPLDGGPDADPDTWDPTDWQVTSQTVQVQAGDRVALSIPREANQITVTSGNPALIRWISNAAALLEPEVPEFDVALYRGHFPDLAALAGQDPVHSVEGVIGHAYSVAAEHLTDLSRDGVPAYTVRVSLDFDGTTLDALSFVHVLPTPAVVNLDRSVERHMLSGGSQQFHWSIDHFHPDHGGEWELAISRSFSEGGEVLEQMIDTTSATFEQVADTNTFTGSFEFNPAAVSGLNDTYTVSVRARNSEADAWSFDSFLVFVYNPQALRIVDSSGQPINSLTLSNRDLLDAHTASSDATDTAAIVALRGQLGLLEHLSINADQYAWSQLRDSIQWRTSDADALPIYRALASGMHEDLRNSGFTQFLPSTRMGVVGLTDAQGVEVTATHATTGMFQTVSVDVETLRDELFLIQALPAVATRITYTTETGQEREVWTNDDGLIALHEPDGIASNLHLWAQAEDTVFLGTLYRSRALSGERNPALLQQYPLNTVTLREAARADLFLVTPNGQPFAGEVEVRGGVRRNGADCLAAEIAPRSSATPGGSPDLALGDEPVTVALADDGHLVVEMDSSQFWCEGQGEWPADVNATLRAADVIEYTFELIPEGHFPLFVTVEARPLATSIASAQSVVVLERVPEGRFERPFVAAQTIDYGSALPLVNVREMAGSVGPTIDNPTPLVRSYILLWGESGATGDWSARIVDEDDQLTANQTAETTLHWFSSMPFIHHELPLATSDLEHLAWHHTDGGHSDLRLQLVDGDQMVRRDQPLPWRVTDLTGARPLDEADEVEAVMVDFSGNTSITQALWDGGDRMTARAIRFLGRLYAEEVDTDFFRMIITPSPCGDNTVFNVLLTGGIDKLNLPDVDYSERVTVHNAFHPPGMDSLDTGVGGEWVNNLAAGNYGAAAVDSYGIGKAILDIGKAEKPVSVQKQLTGFMEGRVVMRPGISEWEVQVLRGGFTAGLGIKVDYSVNLTDVGLPIPLFAQIKFEGAAQIRYEARLLREQAPGMPWREDLTAQTVNNHLTQIRVRAYIEAFAGLGFDYTIVSFKAGIFGNLMADYTNRILSRPYLDNQYDRRRVGGHFTLTGNAGIRFEVKLLFINFTHTLVSIGFEGAWRHGSWEEIENYWAETGAGLTPLIALGEHMALIPLGTTASIQPRDYLTMFERTGRGPRLLRSDAERGHWAASSSPFSFAAPFGATDAFAFAAPNTLSADLAGFTQVEQTNAYPFAFPLVTHDGHHLLYLHDAGSTDVADTRVFASTIAAGLDNGKVIDTAGFGDADLDLAGDARFAVASWVRQTHAFDVMDSSELSRDEQALLMNATEIVAATNAGSGWVTTVLTDDAWANLAPAVATNGEEALVVWRRVSIGDFSDLLEFDDQRVMGRHYTAADGWGEPFEIYNGTSGDVKGLDVAMLPSGESIVVLALDRSEDSDQRGDIESVTQDIAFVMIDANGNVDLPGIVENDQPFNENPQVTVASLHGEPHFILAWHSAGASATTDSSSAKIGLAAVTANGAVATGFLESISDATQNVAISPTFRFARTTPGAPIGDLSIVWTQSVDEHQDALKAVQFREGEAGYGLTGVIDLVGSHPEELVDLRIVHFDAYAPQAGTITSLVQGNRLTEFGSTQDVDVVHVCPDTGAETWTTLPVTIPETVSVIYTASAAYRNQISVPTLGVDFANLRPNSTQPITLHVVNEGLTDIVGISVELDGVTHAFNEIATAPNQTVAVTANQEIGAVIENLDYTLTAFFDDGTQAVVGGTVHLFHPDIGISQLLVTSEDAGRRTVLVTLYNETDMPLADSDREVRIGFYADSDFAATALPVLVSDDRVLPNEDGTFTIAEEARSTIDAGAFTFEAVFDVRTVIEDGTEIPDAGIALHAHTWLERAGEILPEINSRNNTATVTFYSLLGMGHSRVPVAFEIDVIDDSGVAPFALAITSNADGDRLRSSGLVANVTASNLALAGPATGYLLATLYDADGVAIEAQIKRELVTIDPESSGIFEFRFSQDGHRVVAQLVPVIDEPSTELVYLTFSGLPVELANFELDANGVWRTSINTSIESTLVNFVTRDPQAIVRINGTVVQGPDVGGENLPVLIPVGASAITIEVECRDGDVVQWVLAVTRPDPNDPGNGGPGNGGPGNGGPGNGGPGNGGPGNGGPGDGGGARHVSRLAGDYRFATAAAISRAAFPSSGIPVAFVALGTNFPDALSGSAKAGHLAGPVLLTRHESLPSSTAAELARLRPAQIVVLGGPAAVSEAVAEHLAEFTTGWVSRLGGANRYETAAAISRATHFSGVAVAYIASGVDFPDALAGSAKAGLQGGPMLLTRPGDLPAATRTELERLQPRRIVVLGGPEAVSEAVASHLAQYTVGSVTRLAGANRFGTAAAISQESFPRSGVPVVYIAVGSDFPDALAGAAKAGLAGGPLLLTQTHELPDATRAELQRLRPRRVVILGGTAVVSRAVETALANYALG